MKRSSQLALLAVAVTFATWGTSVGDVPPAPPAPERDLRLPGPLFAKAEPDPDSQFRKKWDAIPVPKKTPFDDSAKKREQYLHSYRHGYFWADGIHLFCPTNPSKDNLHAIRGWVEGWQAGVKAGGTGDLPSKYAPYLVWRDPE